MQVEEGLQTNHSEDQILIAKYRNSKNAENAALALVRRIKHWFTVEEEFNEKVQEAMKDVPNQTAKDWAESYKIESQKRAEIAAKLNACPDGFDWNMEEAGIGWDKTSVKFTVYSAGYGITAIEEFLSEQPGYVKTEYPAEMYVSPISEIETGEEPGESDKK